MEGKQTKTLWEVRKEIVRDISSLKPSKNPWPLRVRPSQKLLPGPSLGASRRKSG